MDPRLLPPAQGQLPPVQLPEPPPAAKRGRKAQGSGGLPRKRTKKQQQADGSDGTTPTPDGAGAAASSSGATPPKAGRPPRAPRGGGRAGGRDRGSKQHDRDREEDELELVAKDEGRVEEEPEEKLGKNHSGVFSKDLPWLMYGFGDADKPIKDTVDLVEDIAVQFITDTVHAAMAAAAARNPGSSSSSSARLREDLRLEDLLFAVRRDPRKVARIQELIRRQQEIKDARKVIAGDVEGGDDMPHF